MTNKILLEYIIKALTEPLFTKIVFDTKYKLLKNNETQGDIFDDVICRHFNISPMDYCKMKFIHLPDILKITLKELLDIEMKIFYLTTNKLWIFNDNFTPKLSNKKGDIPGPVLNNDTVDDVVYYLKNLK